MESTGLIFIPDISGFTKFIQEVEISHSRLIIQELLETLINANHIGLQVSEVEGDAILFYKFGQPPTLEEIYKQVETMFKDFHAALKAYDNRKYCYCAACVSAIDLSLKVITHYGEFSAYTVKDFNKLIGKDIIVAHQLLKNDIDKHEYWLVTHELAEGQRKDLEEWMEWSRAIKHTGNGDIAFHYTQLTPLKEQIELPPLSGLSLRNPVKVMSFERDFDADLITMCRASADFYNRDKWHEGVDKVEHVDHILPRVGMKCTYLKGGRRNNAFSSGYFFSDEKIEFGETDEDRSQLAYTTLTKLGDQKTRLVMDYFIDKDQNNRLLFNLIEKKKVKAIYEKSLDNLSEFVKDLQHQ
jgi:hypothetical protein